MTHAPSTAATAAPSETDLTARKPLGMLLAAAFLWLLVSGGLSLVTAIQLHTPGFLADCAMFTHGRAQALQETVFIYGWAANAAFAVAVWILGRLSGAPLRGVGLMTVGTFFWNLAVLVGLVAIAVGELTGIPFLQMPAYVHPFLLVAGAAIATPGILAWTGRRITTMFAAQWYAVAALLLFVWSYSTAQVLLLASPVHGVAQAVVAAWFAETEVSLWLIPVALAAAYYLLPKISGRVIPNYDYAPHGFWTLIFFAPFTGARSLVGAPVPAWIPTLAIVCSSLLLFHYFVLGLNLRAGLAGGRGNPILSFVSAGLLVYLLGGIVTAVFAFRGFAQIVQFTFFPVAQLKLMLAGAFSLPIFGAIYFLAPRVTGVAWPSTALIRAHFVLTVLGLTVTVVSLAIAGWVQGHGLLDPAKNFAAIAASTKPWLLAATAGEAIFLLGSVIAAFHFFRLQCAACRGLLCGSPATLEASAS